MATQVFYVTITLHATQYVNTNPTCNIMSNTWWNKSQCPPNMPRSKLREHQQKTLKLQQQTVQEQYMQDDIGLSFMIKDIQKEQRK